MMTVAQKVPFELVALDGPASGFTESSEVAAALADAIQAIPASTNRASSFSAAGNPPRAAPAPPCRWSANASASSTSSRASTSSPCARRFVRGARAHRRRQAPGFHLHRAARLLGWATGNLPEPPNNPQVGMLNMRTVMPALQKAKPVKLANEGVAFASVALPKQRRDTKIVKDLSPDAIAREIVEWIGKE
jgi:electron transfer flavoprotein beta subunit